MDFRGKMEWAAVLAWSTASGLRLTPFSGALDCSGFETELHLRRSALWSSFCNASIRMITSKAVNSLD
jgi:hypothetical protein